MGFFTGTESDPDVANSRCVTYFPILQGQFSLVVDGFNSSLVIPTRFIAWIDNVFTLINKYALWQNYCVFSTLFTRLDNTISTFEGLTTVFSRYIFNIALIQVQISDMNTYWGASDCFKMMRSVGIIFSTVLDFNVPEDIV